MQYNFIVLRQDKYIDKNFYFSVDSTSLNTAVKYSCNAIFSLESLVSQAGKNIKKHKMEHNMVKTCGRNGWNLDAK